MRWLFVCLATTLHHLLIILIRPWSNSAKLLSMAKKSPRLVRLRSADEYFIALKVSRRLSRWLAQDNTCFITSLTLFWLGDESTRLHFSLDDQQKGHAWVERDNVRFTTDQSENHRSFHIEARSP